MICPFKREKRKYMLSAQLNIFVFLNSLKNYYCTLKVSSLEFAHYQMTKLGAYLRSKAYLVGNYLRGRGLLFMVIFSVIVMKKGNAIMCVKLPTVLEGGQNRLACSLLFIPLKCVSWPGAAFPKLFIEH